MSDARKWQEVKTRRYVIAYHIHPKTSLTPCMFCGFAFFSFMTANSNDERRLFWNGEGQFYCGKPFLNPVMS